MVTRTFIFAVQALAILLATASAEKKLIPAICSMGWCTLMGANSFCVIPNIPGNPIFTTCAKFATSEESRKQCSFACPDICLPEDQRPLASNGQKFCSACHLRQASCKSGYKIFGPVRPSRTPKPSVNPTPSDACSVSLCTSKGAAQQCVFKGTSSTCGKWAGTSEKRVQCDFQCLQICLPPGKQPVDNFGRSYCSVCHLRQASCRSNFKIFGPVSFGIDA